MNNPSVFTSDFLSTDSFVPTLVFGQWESGRYYFNASAPNIYQD